MNKNISLLIKCASLEKIHLDLNKKIICRTASFAPSAEGAGVTVEAFEFEVAEAFEAAEALEVGAVAGGELCK